MQVLHELHPFCKGNGVASGYLGFLGNEEYCMYLCYRLVVEGVCQWNDSFLIVYHKSKWRPPFSKSASWMRLQYNMYNILNT